MARMLSLAALAACAAAAAPLPTSQHQLGWQFGNTNVPAGKGVFIELFGDFQCPDTRTAWLSVFKDLDQWILKENKPVTIRYVPFPLPYHYNAYRAALAGIVGIDLISKNGVSEADAFKAVADQIFAPAQDSFQNGPTANQTDAQIDADTLFPLFQAAGVKAADKQAWVDGVHARPNDLQLRTAWKYGCSRGVSGTPQYTVNGVVSDEAAGWDLVQWQNFINGAN